MALIVIVNMLVIDIGRKNGSQCALGSDTDPTAGSGARVRHLRGLHGKRIT